MILLNMKSKYTNFISHLYSKLINSKDLKTLELLRIWEAGLSGEIPDVLKRHHEEYTLRHPETKIKDRERN